MSTLADREIQVLSESGKLIAEQFSPASLTPNGYDLRIGSLRLMNSMDDTEEVRLERFSGAWISTMEYVNLPGDVMGQIWIRSSYARTGILGSFGAVEAGYHGCLTLTIFNMGSSTVTMKKGDRVAQIVFHRLSSTPEKLYAERSGNYAGLRGISTGPMVE